jgi:glycosyltransferase involved in cell wall biosynthesis
MLKVAAFTGGRSVASARFRVRQYVEPLQALGIRLKEHAAWLGSFPPRTRYLRPAWGASSLASRLPSIAAAYLCDLTILQRELISTLVTLESWMPKRRVWDIDDAVWLHPRGGRLHAIASNCTAIICGNSFIGEWARQHNPSVSVIPTAVDTARFCPGAPSEEPQRVVIGWMGQSSGYAYLQTVIPAIERICSTYPFAKLRVISDVPPPRSWSDSYSEFVQWRPNEEVRQLQTFDIGIMPVDDSPWSLGKCSYKMLLYMSCGKPVVVSDIGMNREVLRDGPVGFGARSADEWIQALECLVRDPTLRHRMGVAGRAVVEKTYSVRELAPRLAAALKAAAN